MVKARTAVIALGLMGLLLAACGTSGSTSNSAKGSTSGGSGSAASSVSSYDSSTYGNILSSTSGKIYYIFSADSKGKSRCTGPCAKVWLPVIGSATVSGGASSSLAATLTRSNGKKQVSYDGHPLYTFTGDSGPNEVNGEGLDQFGGYWYVISTSGKPVTSSSGRSSTYASSNTSSSKSKSGSGW